jgi:4-carboxymuconolactone decarboxylase
MADDRFENGMVMRKRVLGADHVARSQANATEFDADFQTFITENVWGSVWTRPGLDMKSRHILTIGMLAALGRTEELAIHIRGAANTGITRSELKELFLQVAAYAGAPAANTAFATARKIFQEMENKGEQ